MSFDSNVITMAKDVVGIAMRSYWMRVNKVVPASAKGDWCSCRLFFPNAMHVPYHRKHMPIYADHPELFLDAGTLVPKIYTLQLYPLVESELDQLSAWASEQGLRMALDREGSWRGPNLWLVELSLAPDGSGSVSAADKG